MASYFETTPQAVEEAMAITGIDHHPLVHALLERGHSVEKITAMTPSKRLDEFLNWNGIIGYTSMIVSAAKAAGHIVGPRHENHDISDEVRGYLEGVVGVVEADSHSKHSLWCDYAEEGAKWGRPEGIRYPWKDTGSGYGVTVGRIGDMSVVISLLTATVNDHKLLFYFATSTFVDHDMIENWLKRHLPETAKGGYPGGYNHTDATNFCNIFRH